MNVVHNGLAALKPKTGVGHHIVEIHRHLSMQNPEDVFDLYPGQAVGRLITRFVHAPQKVASPSGRPSRKARLGGMLKSMAKSASQAHFTSYLAAGRFDLYHEPNFHPYRTHLPTVVTVHDLSVLRHPEWHPADRVRLRHRHFLRGLERAAAVIVVSEAVRQELLDDTGMASERVHVVPNGVNPRFRPIPERELTATRHRIGLPENYFLCVGTIEPRKNIDTVLRAFADLPASVRESCPLLLAGPWGWKSESVRSIYDQWAEPRGARHLGYIADADLPALYAGATALLYPSYYEGFGLPPLEMLACGGAVIASSATAVREVLGCHGRILEPDDVIGWRDTMHQVVAEPEYASSLKVGGVAHAAKFTWAKAAEGTAAVYRRVLGLNSLERERRVA